VRRGEGKLKIENSGSGLSWIQSPYLDCAAPFPHSVTFACVAALL